MTQWLTSSIGLSASPRDGSQENSLGAANAYGVSWSSSKAGMYHGAAPPCFSTRTTTLRSFSIISPRVGSAWPGDHDRARSASPPRSRARIASAGSTWSSMTSTTTSFGFSRRKSWISLNAGSAGAAPSSHAAWQR